MVSVICILDFGSVKNPHSKLRAYFTGTKERITLSLNYEYFEPIIKPDRSPITPFGHKKEKAPRWGFSNLLILLSFLAGAAGFEPATYGFGDRRSTS